MKRTLTIISIVSLSLCTSLKAHASELRYSHSDSHYSHGHEHSKCHPVFRVYERKGIYFEGLAGFNQVITVSPSSYNSAIFSIRGGIPYAWIKLSVKNESLYPLNPMKKDKVKLRDYKFGGTATYDGYAMLDRQGNLDNVRLGASVKIKTKNNSNIYYGTPELKADYLW